MPGLHHTRTVALLCILTGTALVAVTSCGPAKPWEGPASATPTRTPLGSLYAQHAAAYPMLEDSDDYLVLCDFETPDQLRHFALASTDAKLFVSGSPTATGQTAIGIAVGQTNQCTLEFTPNIKRWHGNNTFLTAVYVRHGGTCHIEIALTKQNTLKQSYHLEPGWNKLQIDLTDPNRRNELTRVPRVTYRFTDMQGKAVFIDDIILLQHRKRLFGDPQGQPGHVYGLQEGRRVRIGSPRRFELVFHNQRIVEWYDLATDTDRINNLAHATGLGPALSTSTIEDRAVVTVRNRVASKSTTMARLICDVFIGPDPQPNQPAEQTYTYTITADGQVTLDIDLNHAPKNLTVDFALNPNQAFEPVIGRIRNPQSPAKTKIEYALLRRMGDQAGADLLAACKPWTDPAAPVACRTRPGRNALRITFSAPARSGPMTLHALLRVWPADIDTITNAERYIRNFIAQTPAVLAQPKPPPQKPTWTPRWNVE